MSKARSEQVPKLDILVLTTIMRTHSVCSGLLFDGLMCYQVHVCDKGQVARTAAQAVPGTVRGEIEMQVRNVVAKDIYVDLLGISGLAQGAGDAGEDCAQRGGFWSVQLGNERDWRRGSRWAESGDSLA